VTLGRELLVPARDLNPRPSVHWSAASVHWSAALSTELAGQLVMGLQPYFTTLPPSFSFSSQAFIPITSDTSGVTLGRKVLVPDVGLEPTTLKNTGPLLYQLI